MVKSELLQNLDDQENKILELSSQVQSLQNSAQVAGVEKKDLLECIKRLEQEKASLSAREKAIQEKYVLEMEQAEERFRLQFKRCEDLEVKLQQEMRQRAEAELRVDAATSRIASLEDASAKNVENSNRKILNLEDRLRKVQKDAQFIVSRTKVENSTEKSRVQFAEAEVQVLKAKCEDLEQRLSESLDEKHDLSQKLAMATSQVSSSSHGQELELVIKHLRDELKSFEADVAEARKMKHYHANVSLLKEKLESERLRAERAEAALEELADREMQVESLERELQSWRNLIEEIPDVERRDDILRKIGDLQREALSAMARVGELTAQITELQADLEKRDTVRCEAQDNANFTQETVNEMTLQNKRLKRKVELLTKERDGLKLILSSYDEEEAMLMSQNKSGAGMQATDTPGRAKEKRIQELEVLVQDLQREGDILRSDLATAELKLGRGDYDPSSTKVVRMVENLDINAEKQVLLAEIQSLREKVKSIQDDTLSSGITASRNAELSLLREQVNSLEKREARYKKVFAEKISVFRQACCLLFGYTVEMSEEQQLSTGMTVTLFTLQSIYAQSEDETIQFQFESNHMNLLANEYTSYPEISRMVDVYLKKFNSIPAFTANLTSELFNKTTLS